MVKFVKGALLTVTVSLALGGIATAAGTLTDAEFKCQTAVSKAGSKFVGSKTKCASKCIANANKGVEPIADCYAPYAGPTLTCIADPLKGAEAKFTAAIRKACDPTFKVGTDCPECYSNGDCTQESLDRPQSIEGQVDSFGPFVFCEEPNSDKAEVACEQNTAKSLAKLVGSVNKCYDKCNANARKGLISQSACVPTASDPTTAACISAADNKAIVSIDAKCVNINALPDCPTPDDYNHGATWVNLVETAISGNVPTTYCASPSGAFLN